MNEDNRAKYPSVTHCNRMDLIKRKNLKASCSKTSFLEKFSSSSFADCLTINSNSVKTFTNVHLSSRKLKSRAIDVCDVA